MDGLRKHHSISALKAQIRALENRPVLAQGASLLAADKVRGLLNAAPGLLHEVFADEMRNSGAALGFTLGQARSLAKPSRPAVFFMQLSHEAQETGLPYGAGLKSFGIDPDMLILVRLESITELLWAMEEAVACRAVAAVIADIGGHHKALDFTATRRLSLRAASAGTSIFIARYGGGREATAAQLRWHVAPQISGEAPFDARASGEARWRVTLEKGELQGEGQTKKSWLLGWTENGFALVDDDRKAAKSASAGAAPHGPVPAALGDRLSQTA